MAVVGAITELGWLERTIISSFDVLSIDTVRAAEPRAVVGVAPRGGRRSAEPARRRHGERATRPCTPSWPASGAELVARAHDAGLAVNVWTVNADADLAAMVALGVDTVITDRVPAALAVARRDRCPGRMASPRGRRRDWSIMNVVVCVKQIPDPAAPQSLSPDTHTLDRSGKLIIDDSDAYGVEMALQLASGEGDEVTLVSMAPGGETSGLRTALAMGAAKAILISDDALAGTDALGTAKVLAAAIRRASPDLVIAATESTDGYTGTVPVQVAELLGLPSITFAKSVAIDGATVKVERQTEAGYDEVECPLPAVVTRDRRRGRAPLPLVQGDHGGQVQARGRADRGRPRPRRRPTSGWPAPARRSPTSRRPRPRGSGEIVVDEGDGAQRIVAFLEQLKVI